MERGTAIPEPSELDPRIIDDIQSMRDEHEGRLFEFQEAAREELRAPHGIYPTVTHYDRLREHTYTIANKSYVEEADLFADNNIPSDADPESHAHLLNLLYNTSPQKMNNTEWFLGTPDAAGNYTNISETSGRSHAIRRLAQLLNAENEETSVSVDQDRPGSTSESQVYEYATSPEVIEARIKLAELSVQRRQMIRSGNKKAKELEEKYIKAQAEYGQALQTDRAAKLAELRGQNLPDDRLISTAIGHLLDEHQEFSQAEIDALWRDDSRRGRFARWLAGKKSHLFGFNVATGVAIGVGTSLIAKGIVSLAIGVTGGAAAGAVAAIRTTQSILMANIGNRVDVITHIVKRSGEDYDKLKEAAGALSIANTLDEELLGRYNNLLQETITNRVDKDRKSNRNRVIAATAIGGAAGAISLIGAEFFEIYLHHTGQHSPQNYYPPTPGGHAPTPPIPKPPVIKPGTVNGFQTHIQVAHGEGYQQSLTELVGQRNISLGPTQSWQLYTHLNNIFHGNFFTNNPSYPMNNPGMWGISRPGASQWDPRVTHEVYEWLARQNLVSSIN